MKVIFLGTPDFAVSVLNAIMASKHEVVAVVTQPDRMNARGNKVIFSPVKEVALNASLPLYQFEKISRDGVEELKAIDADIMVTAAYGQILSEEVLNMKKYGVINAHASLLPKYRGSSPVQWALINGEKEIGVTCMQTAYEVDSGAIINQMKVALNGDENAEECLDMLAKLGGESIVKALDDIDNGVATYTEQNHSEATHCRKLTKEDGKIDFNDTAVNVVNRIRAFTPWPSAYCTSRFGRVKILKAFVVDGDFEGANGEVLVAHKSTLTIKCASGAIGIQVIQAENSRAMDVQAFLNGKSIQAGEIFE